MSTSEKILLHENLCVQFPEVSETIDQDEEWCTVIENGKEERIRFHDYNRVYTIPGLYEHLFYEKLKCNSPQVICNLLKEELNQTQTSFDDLKVLEIGAGNGMVGEELKEKGVESIVGLDIIEEAKSALERDRPNVYEDYLVDDLTQLSPKNEEKLEMESFNCLVTVAALGFGDIPPAAFSKAYNFIDSPGWVAFNIRDRFMTEEDPSGFCLLVREMKKEGLIDMKTVHRFRHRYSLDGKPLYYNGVIAEKKADIPTEMLEKVDRETS